MEEPDPLLGIDLASRFDQLDLVDAVLESALSQLGQSGDFVDHLCLAVREAVANAILHGNRQREDKRVRMEVSAGDRKVIIRVRDEGEGFDPASVPDPLNPDNLLKASGRGLLLMRSLTDELNFSFESGGGTLVTLAKSFLAAGSAANKEESENEDSGP